MEIGNYSNNGNKVLHIIGGGDVGGAKVHVLSLVKELSRYIDVKIVSLRPGIFADEAVAMGIDIEVVKSRNIFKDMARVKKIAVNGSFGIIHSHGAKANIFSLAAGLTTGIPTVTTVHSDYKLDYMHSTLKRLTIGNFNAIALRFIDYYTGVTRNFKEMLIERGFNPENINILYNGMDFEKETGIYSRSDFIKKYSLNIKESNILVGIAARLNPVKDLATLLNAAAIVVSQNPDVKFLIAGDGEEHDSLIKKADQLGISDHVVFLGWLSDPYELMSNVDISVLTSISEGFPYSILEGARFKKATISSAVGGIPDLIESGLNGYLFTPRDHVTLAKFILELAGDSDKRHLMGERIFQKARKSFSLEGMCHTQIEIYKRILRQEALRRGINDTGSIGVGDGISGASIIGSVGSIGSDSSVYISGGNRYDAIISGYYGFRNIGDDALLMAIINDLHRYSDEIRIIVLSSNPLETRKTYGINAINRINLFKVTAAMKKARLFIYGGGTLIQESTSTRSLLFYLATIWMAKKMGLKVMLYGNGIEPINKRINRQLTQKIVNMVDVITLREENSLKELGKLRIDRPSVFVTADPALTITPAPPEKIDEIFLKEGIDSKGPFVGISARKWEGRKNYEAAIATAADYIVENLNAVPVFIPMQFPDDLQVVRSIAAKMKQRAHIISEKHSVPEVLGIIGRMDLLIGMRLHALIFAANSGVPVIGLVYQPKVEWFLEYIGQPSASAGNVKDMDATELIKLIDKVWMDRKVLGYQVAGVMAGLRSKALEDAKTAILLIEKSKQEELEKRTEDLIRKEK